AKKLPGFFQKPNSTAKTIDPNQNFGGLAVNPDLTVTPPSGGIALPYKCDKEAGICISYGVEDSIQLERDKAEVCKGDVYCYDKGCYCDWKQ
ncbi:MAG TPA: hypothetical protein VJ772_01890, partial [Nitrososphaeraceae archaeon]|nr:hypothetical protein [Nitrososphaeraceae archaeon]